MRKIVIWYNQNRGVYYYRYVFDSFKRYYPGYVNQYSHVVIMVIDVYKELIYKPSLKKRVLSRLIYFLQKINR